MRNVDQYGYRVHLNYDGEETFKTVFGGSMTFLSRFLILIYLAFALNAVVMRSRSSITETYFYKNLVFDEEQIAVNKEHLEFSVLINYSPDERRIKVDNIF